MTLPDLFDVVITEHWVGVVVEIDEPSGEAIFMFFGDEDEARDWVAMNKGTVH